MYLMQWVGLNKKERKNERKKERERERAKIETYTQGGVNKSLHLHFMDHQIRDRGVKVAQGTYFPSTLSFSHTHPNTDINTHVNTHNLTFPLWSLPYRWISSIAKAGIHLSNRRHLWTKILTSVNSIALNLSSLLWKVFLLQFDITFNVIKVEN